MTTPITVNRKLQVSALLTINDPDFAHWYGLGVWWAMNGDGQGLGLYDDCYLIVNMINHIRSGWYNDSKDGWFAIFGFELGMLHGGYLVRPSDTLVVLTDLDFAKGYHVGRDYCFNEAPLENRVFSDTLFAQSLQEWAAGYSLWSEPDAVLRYCLGCRIGELSGALIPDLKPVPAS